MMGTYYNYGYWPGFGFSWIFVCIFWVFLVWGIIALFRGPRRYHHHGHMGMMMDKDNDNDKALDILRERYAKGDITKEEYEEKKEHLMK